MTSRAMELRTASTRAKRFFRTTIARQNSAAFSAIAMRENPEQRRPVARMGVRSRSARALMLAIALVLVLPLSAALASHGQDSDTGNATCPSLYGKLYGNAYAHEWQQQTHDGVNWRPANYTGYQWKNYYWGLHAGPAVEYVSVVGGGPSVSISVTCPNSGIS